MKKFIKDHLVAIVISALCIAAFGLIFMAVRYTNANFERAKIERDSIAEAKKYEDSVRAVEAEQQRQYEIRKAEEARKRLEEAERKYLPLMKVEKDDFSDCEWIYPKSRPAYINTNHVYCYFTKYNDGRVGNFRFRFQYADKNWLFIEKMKFNIDGVNYTLTPNIKRDHNATIWEWCDEGVADNSSNGVTWSFVRALAHAKTVKVRLVGMNYEKDKTIPAAQIRAIKEVYEYFIALTKE